MGWSMERPWPGLIPHVLSKSECSPHIKQKFWQSKLGGAHSSNPDPPICDAFTKQGNKLSAAPPTKAWSPFPTPCDSLWPTHSMWQKWHSEMSSPSLKRSCSFHLYPLGWPLLPDKEVQTSLLETQRPKWREKPRYQAIPTIPSLMNAPSPASQPSTNPPTNCSHADVLHMQSRGTIPPNPVQITKPNSRLLFYTTMLVTQQQRTVPRLYRNSWTQALPQLAVQSLAELVLSGVYIYSLYFVEKGFLLGLSEHPPLQSAN